MTISRRTLAIASALALSAVALPAHAQEVTLNAAHFTPAQVSYAKSFLAFVAKLNERGKGVVQIRVRGGPEVIPFAQLGESQKNGLIDMINAPAGAYLNLVPEGEVLSATAKTPSELRANGGYALLNEIYAKKGNAIILAHVDGGSGFHIFTTDAPPMTAAGSVDFTKLKIRSAPLQRDFLESLGASVIVQPPSEAYTSLERGLVTAHTYTIAGYQGFGWDKFTKFRIDPSYFQTDVLITMNKAKWDGLSEAAKKIIQDVAREHETASIAENLAATKLEGQQMIDKGMKVVTLPEAAAKDFLAKAAKASWDRLEKRDPTRITELRAKFQ